MGDLRVWLITPVSMSTRTARAFSAETGSFAARTAPVLLSRFANIHEAAESYIGPADACSARSICHNLAPIWFPHCPVCTVTISRIYSMFVVSVKTQNK